MLGLVFVCCFVSFCAMLVVSERRASACIIMLSPNKVATGTIFNALGMAGFELTISRSRADALPVALSDSYYFG